MRTAIARVESVSPLSWGKRVRVERLGAEETDAEYEARTWREKFHHTPEGEAYIPPMAFKLSLEIAAKNFSKKIPGKGNATYTKHFAAGVLVPEPVMLGIALDALEEEWLFVPANGQKGGGKRVDKCFPLVRSWSASVRYYVLDPTITTEIFETYLEKSGQFIGVGFFRPERGGYYGRFKVNEIQWS